MLDLPEKLKKFAKFSESPCCIISYYRSLFSFKRKITDTFTIFVLLSISIEYEKCFTIIVKSFHASKNLWRKRWVAYLWLTLYCFYEDTFYHIITICAPVQWILCQRNIWKLLKSLGFYKKYVFSIAERYNEAKQLTKRLRLTGTGKIWTK